MPPEAILGFDTADDAAVWRIAPNIAGILTIDFLTPIVDEPYDFGRIAAANALSAVFAMGGVPNVALNVVAMDSTLPEYVPRDMLRGGLEKVIEAGAVIMGGHSIDDEEPKYGLCVFGTVAPDALVRNEGAKPGDTLYLTKPLGTGIASAGRKVGILDDAAFSPVVESMTELNRAAGEAMVAAGVHAATDVTGFGLALPFGYLAERFLRSPALVGYILAGVAVGIIPGLPPVNEAMIEQLAEIGVMLLMFGVGLHFSVRDLLNVRTAVVPWAAVQMMVTAILGACVAMGFWHWSFGAAVLFGLTISCASTVVVTKALELRRMTNEINGQVAIGWLVMEDLMSVVLLVCLPPFAQAVQGADVSLSAVAWKVATTLIWAAVFVVLMLVAGRKVMPRLLREVALTGSNELFTLSVLGCAIVIAYGAGAIFNVSFALGAFFAGMVMQCEPIDRCISQLKAERDYDEVIFTSPDGEQFDQHVANDLSMKGNIIILCGHYKGIDQRVRDHLITREISIGDYVLTGGELAAAIIADAVVRVVPGVIGDEQSALSDCFQDDMLSAPIYTRPADYKGWKVPEILLSGNEAKIKNWEMEQAMERTQRLRPDLLEK